MSRQTEYEKTGKRMHGFSTEPGTATYAAQLTYLNDIAAKYKELIEVENNFNKQHELAE